MGSINRISRESKVMPVLRLQPLTRFSQQIRYACTNSLVSFHHTTGSEIPTINPEKLTLINMRFCPYAQRTVLCLNAKGIDYEVINSQLMNKPEWLWELNPLGKVPVLVHKGNKIPESLITCDYIDEVFPGRQLHSSDAAAKAKDKMLVEMFNKVLMPHMRIVFGWKRGMEPEKRANHWAESLENLETFEDELQKRDTTFFGGSAPGYLDYMIWPWFERINIFPRIFEGESALAFPAQKFPILSSWMKSMKEDPAVKEYILDEDVHVQFFKSLSAGSPNYNLLYKE